MSNFLIPAAVPDTTSDLRLVARDPEEMRVAQTQMIAWFAGKEEILRRDLDGLAEQIAIAEREGWLVEAFQRQASTLRRRVRFYEKCRLASEQGYCVIPNLPLDVFAIRTKRSAPKRKLTKWRQSSFRQSSESPPSGLGEWVDSVPTVGSFEEVKTDPNTKVTATQQVYFADEFTEIDFPVSIARPELMNAAASAMAGKFFDEIGVLPSRSNRKDDPLVVGVVYDPTRYRRAISFLIAWYVDTAQL